MEHTFLVDEPLKILRSRRRRIKYIKLRKGWGKRSREKKKMRAGKKYLIRIDCHCVFLLFSLRFLRGFSGDFLTWKRSYCMWGLFHIWCLLCWAMLDISSLDQWWVTEYPEETMRIYGSFTWWLVINQFDLRSFKRFLLM